MPFVTEGTMSPTAIGRNDDWGTPQDQFDRLDAEVGGFDIDVCADARNHKCEKYWTIEEDGLSQAWVMGLYHFMNPPYGRTIGKWIRKAADSADAGAIVYAVIPCRTDARWWGDVMRATEIRFIKGRLHYDDAPNAAPFPSCIVVWGTPRKPGFENTPAISWVDSKTGEVVA